MKFVILLSILLNSLCAYSQSKIPEKFPKDYVIEEWCVFGLNGQYVFYSNNRFLFIKGGMGPIRKTIEIGVWERIGNKININIDTVVGLRGIGEPTNYNDRLVGTADNPEELYEFEEYTNFEYWVNKKRNLDLDKFFNGECNLDTSHKAADLNLDINQFRIPGEYKFVSCKYLKEEDLKDYSKYELRLMRNEVFARYGYRFESIDLIRYFTSQPWFKYNHSFKNSYLTKIEKENISLIKSIEEK